LNPAEAKTMPPRQGTKPSTRDLIAGVHPAKAGIAETFDRYGDLSLGAYAATFGRNAAAPLQARDDLARAAAASARPILGAATAAALERHLRSNASILTANHLGVDCHDVYVQGSLLYALADLSGDGCAPGEEPVAPVFAYGSVSLNNATWPRGILLARPRRAADGRWFPVRINLFPAGQRHTMVSRAPAFTGEMVRRAVREVASLTRQEVLSPVESRVVQEILQTEFSSAPVLGLDRYAEQAMAINAALWGRALAAIPGAPRFVYLEMEKIVAELLLRDLRDSATLAHRVLFDPQLRAGVVAGLNGKDGCWALPAKGEAAAESGTVFFWGIDPQGRRVHLRPVAQGAECWLAGVDRAGGAYRFPCTPEAVCAALAAGRLLPGLFLTFVQVAFARGYRCFGGPWQTTYLPIMRAGLVRALRAIPGYRAWAAAVAQAPAANQVSGLTFALADYGGERRAAGMMEMLAAGGLGGAELARIRAIRVGDALRNGLVLERLAQGETCGGDDGWGGALILRFPG